jgi:hypothetical protein
MGPEQGDGLVLQADDEVCMCRLEVALEMPMKTDRFRLILKYYGSNTGKQ